MTILSYVYTKCKTFSFVSSFDFSKNDKRPGKSPVILFPQFLEKRRIFSPSLNVYTFRRK